MPSNKNIQNILPTNVLVLLHLHNINSGHNQQNSVSSSFLPNSGTVEEIEYLFDFVKAFKT